MYEHLIHRGLSHEDADWMNRAIQAGVCPVIEFIEGAEYPYGRKGIIKDDYMKPFHFVNTSFFDSLERNDFRLKRAGILFALANKCLFQANQTERPAIGPGLNLKGWQT